MSNLALQIPVIVVHKQWKKMGNNNNVSMINIIRRSYIMQGKLAKKENHFVLNTLNLALSLWVSGITLRDKSHTLRHLLDVGKSL